MQNGFIDLNKLKFIDEDERSDQSSQSYCSSSSSSEHSFDSLKNMTKDNKYFEGPILNFRRGTKLASILQDQDVIDYILNKKAQKAQKLLKKDKKFDDRFENLLKHDHRSALIDLNTLMDVSIKELASTSCVGYKKEKVKKMNDVNNSGLAQRLNNLSALKSKNPKAAVEIERIKEKQIPRHQNANFISKSRSKNGRNRIYSEDNGTNLAFKRLARNESRNRRENHFKNQSKNRSYLLNTNQQSIFTSTDVSSRDDPRSIYQAFIQNKNMTKKQAKNIKNSESSNAKLVRMSSFIKEKGENSRNKRLQRAQLAHQQSSVEPSKEELFPNLNQRVIRNIDNSDIYQIIKHKKARPRATSVFKTIHIGSYKLPKV